MSVVHGTAKQFTPPSQADLSDREDAEVWLDLVTAAVTGYCGAAWAKKGGRPHQHDVVGYRLSDGDRGRGRGVRGLQETSRVRTGG